MIEVSPAMLRLAYETLGESAPDLWRPAARVRRLGELAPRLLALYTGAQRLAEWTPRVGPDEPLAHRRRRLRQDLAIYGDGRMADQVIDVLATIVPAPVREFAIAEICFILVGQESAAWTSRLGLRGSQLVVISGTGRDPDALAFLAAHEIVHCWQSQRVPLDLPALTAPHE
jgi:hypothetical protein